MTFRKLNNNYHDSHLVRYKLGPRKELSLNIHLDSVWNKDAAEVVVVRFGGIKNYEFVKEKMETLVSSSATDFICEIVGIIYEHKGKWIIDLDEYGSILVESSKCTEQ